MTPNVLVLETYADDYARALIAAFPSLSVRKALKAADVGAWDDFDVLITFGIGITPEQLGSAKRLKWVQCLATGVDHFLKNPGLRKDVILTNGRGIHGPPLREVVALLMLSLSHETPRLARQQTAHVWDRKKPWPLLAGKTAAIVGVGLIGTAVAEVLKVFGMKVVGVTRTPRDVPGFDLQVSTDRLLEVVAEADYVIDILPDEPQNLRIMDARIFASMKPSAFFVNVGRGPTVDEPALIEALKKGEIAGAGLDVFTQEPLPADDPLWDAPNLIIYPHIGGFMQEYAELALPIIIDSMRAFIAGKPGEMRNVIPH